MKTFYTCILFFMIAIYCDAQIQEIVDGYTDKLSYRSGEVITFFTKHSGNQTSFDLKDFGGNIIPSTLPSYAFTTTITQPTPSATAYMDGFPYLQTNTWQVDSLSATFKSGYYLLNYTDPNNNIPIIIKGNLTSDIVIVCPTNTINAYTKTNGISLYDVSIPTTTVSFLRPQNRVNYGNCDDAFLDWIRIWAATAPHNYSLNFISDADMDDWDEIKNAKLLIIPGHSEYWTRQARLNFDAFVDSGKNALILSGNTMWAQVRYEDQNYYPDSTKTKLTCYRGANWCTPPNDTPCYSPDSTADSLLGTYAWMSTDLKYSVLGSIGSDWLRGGQDSFAYNGHKIINPNSPLLNVNGVPITLPNIGGDPYIPNSLSNTEYDGTLVKSDTDGNAILVSGEPVLDLAALGFYQGEIIGYEYGMSDADTSNHQQFNDPDTNNNNQHYFPFMVFKKTYTSGTVVNVNSSSWCQDDTSGWTGSDSIRAVITANMINLMIADYDSSKNGELLFTNAGPNNPGPRSIDVKPSYSTVSYSACSDGRINFTHLGIYLDKAYKVDKGFTSNPDHEYISSTPQTRYIDYENNSASAFFDPNCSTYQPLRIKSQEISQNEIYEQIDDLAFSLFPNPATGKFTLKMLSENNSEKNIFIFNSIDQNIYRKKKYFEQNIAIDLSFCTKGIYFVKVAEGSKVVTKKIVIN